MVGPWSCWRVDGLERFFFKVADARLHIIEVLVPAVFIALVIFMILSLDRPFRGDLGIRADSYQLIYDHVMKASP